MGTAAYHLSGDRIQPDAHGYDVSAAACRLHGQSRGNQADARGHAEQRYDRITGLRGPALARVRTRQFGCARTAAEV